MFCRRSFMRWIIVSAMIFWGLNSLGLNLWPLFGVMVAFIFLFKGDIARLSQHWSDSAESSPPRKRKNHIDTDMPANLNMKFDNEDGLNRRIIRASDGEILVAVEDPQTGMLYLEEQA